MKRVMVAVIVAWVATAGVALAQTTLPAGMSWRRYSPAQKPPVPAEWPRRSVELVLPEAFDHPQYKERLGIGTAMWRMWEELSAAQKAAGRVDVIVELQGPWGGRPEEDEAGRRTITVIAPPPAGEQDLEAAVRWLRSKLTETKLSPEQRWNKVEEVIGKLERNQRFQNLVYGLVEAQLKVKPEMVLERMQAMQAEGQKVEVELMAKKVRGEALRRQIAQAEKESQVKVGEDAILRQLERVLALRLEDTKRLQEMVKAGAAGQSDMRAAEERIAEVQLRIEERKEALKQGSKGELLTRLSNELALLMVDQTELEMRLAIIREQTVPADLMKLTEKDLEKVMGGAAGMERKEPPILEKLDEAEHELSWELLKLVVVEVKDVGRPGR